MTKRLTVAATAGTATLALASMVFTGVAEGSEHEPVEYCVGEAITPEAAARGEVVEVTCSTDPYLLEPQASTVLSYHWDHPNAGARLTITGTSCSHVVVFGSGHSWDNRIQSTRPLACGNVKHFDHANHTGDNEAISGSTRQSLTSMRSRTSSMNYS